MNSIQQKDKQGKKYAQCVIESPLLLLQFDNEEDRGRCISISDVNCVKFVPIWSFSGPHFPTFGLNTEIYSADQWSVFKQTKFNNSDALIYMSR